MAEEKKDTEKQQKKAPAKKPARKPAAKKETATKAPAKKPAAKKPAAKKPAAKKPAAKKPPAKKPAAEKPTAAEKKPAAKKAAPKTKADTKPKKEAGERPVVNASARFVRLAPRKARLVADQVRGLPIDDAIALLRFSSRGAARDIRKLIESAAANAEANHDLIGDDLVVKTVYVDEGPTIKRWRARARGRAVRVRKRMCHITLTLAPATTATVTRAPEAPAEEKPKRAPRRKAAPKAKAETKPKAEASEKKPASRKRASSQPSNLEATLSHHTDWPGPPGTMLMSFKRNDSSTAFLSH